MIAPALIAVVLLSSPAKPPSVPPPPTPEGEVFALSPCGNCRSGPAVVSGGAPGTFTAQWNAVESFSTFFRTFDASGNATPEQRVSGTPTKGGGVGTAADGSFRMGWLQPGEVFAQSLGPNGALAGNGIHVNAGHPPRVDDDDASIAVRPDGSFLIVWDRLTYGDPSITPHVLSRSGDAGGALGPFVELGTIVGRSFPTACFNPSGTGVVAWILRREEGDGVPTPAGIALRRIAPDGTPTGSVVEAVPPKDVTWDPGHALACAPDGGFYVAWHTLQRPAKKGNDVVVQRFNAKGAKVGKPMLLNTTTAGDQTFPALLFEKSGNLLVVWASANGAQGEIRGRRISSKGKPLGTEFVLHRPSAEILVTYPALATVGERGQFVVTWNEGEKNFARIFRP